jgi:hypothetical protein
LEIARIVIPANMSGVRNETKKDIGVNVARTRETTVKRSHVNKPNVRSVSEMARRTASACTSTAGQSQPVMWLR